MKLKWVASTAVKKRIVSIFFDLQAVLFTFFIFIPLFKRVKTIKEAVPMCGFG